MTHPKTIVALAITAIVLFATALPVCGSSPSTPILHQIVPRGLQRGTTKELTFHGERLFDAKEVFFYDDGVEVEKLEQVNDKAVKVTIKVSPECRIGEHVAQLRTASGVTDFRNFYVGVLPEIDEAEPNSSFESPQQIEMNHTVNGVITGEDIDWFQFKATAGQRISVEIEAIRLGVMFDPWIELRDADGKELVRCDDTPLTKQDGHFSIKAPADGTYSVMVRETSYGGSDQCRYRLHVGDFPRPTLAFPAGGKFGETVELTFYGDPDGPVKKSVTLPSAEDFRGGIFYQDDSGVCPSPLPFLLSDLDSSQEVEPNDTFVEQDAVTLPCAIDGCLAAGDKFDFLRFTAKKNQTWIIDCRARKIGSPLDPVINVYSAKTKKHLGGNDDFANAPDSKFRFKVPEDGDYFVRVRDHLNRTDDNFVYRVQFQKPRASVALAMRRNDRFSQRRQQIAIPQGNRFGFLMDAKKVDFGGQIKLIADSLPEGVTMECRPMAASMNFMPVVFSASQDAVIEGGLFDIVAQSVDESKPVTSDYRLNADLALGPNKRPYFVCDVDQAAIAVLDPVPFKIEMVPPKTLLLRDGSMNVKVKVHRDEGFDKDVFVQFPFRSPGVGTTYQIKIPKGKTEIDYPINANGNSALGKWPVYILGWAEVRGKAWVSSQLSEIEVAEPRVKIQMAKTSLDRGQSAELKCAVEQLIPFEGEATAELVGLPPHVTSNSPLKFDVKTESLVFKIETTDKSRPGKHSPLIKVKIPHQGEMMVANAGRGEVRINKPRSTRDKKVAAK